MSRTPPTLFAPPPWTPTRVLRLVAPPYSTSMGTAWVRTDDARAPDAFLKALGNNEGPHALARELVATRLARWFGLPVPDFAVVDLPAGVCYDLPRSGRTLPGPAFASRRLAGRTWDGTPDRFGDLVNPATATRMVVFDTWVRNYDRHPPDLADWRPNYANVFLADADDGTDRVRLVAIDHTHCFHRGAALTAAVAHLDAVRDDLTYGLFPAFAGLLDRAEAVRCRDRLRALPAAEVRGIVQAVPAAWEVPDAVRAALVEQIPRRAAVLADRIDAGWPPAPAGPAAAAP